MHSGAFVLDPVVQGWISVNKANYIIFWVVINPMDSVIRLSSNRSLLLEVYLSDQKLTIIGLCFDSIVKISSSGFVL